MGGPQHWTRPGRPVFRPRARPGRHGHGSARTSAPTPARPRGKRVPRVAMPPSSRRPTATRSRSSRPRRRTGCRTSCRCATRGWPSRRSPTTGARRRSWPSTSPRRPRTDIIVQASGDAHLSNFGLFASPERTLVFDANDFDETLPGPWEWDVKRLAASMVIAGRANGFSAVQNREATMATVRGYRQWMARYAGMRLLDVWYASITDDDIREAAEATGMLARPDRGGAPRSGSRPSSARRAARRHACLRVADRGRRRPPGHPRRPAGDHPRRLRGRSGGPREGLHRLPGDDVREPARLPRALPVRRLRAQGRRRRERRDALLRPRPRGPRRERPAHPPGEGGDGVGHGAATSRRASTPTTASASSSASS